MSDSNTTDSRQESNVTTQETILAKIATPTSQEPEAKPEEVKDHPKRSPSERIRDAIERRNKAEEEANKAKQETAELRAQLEALKANANPMEEATKPQRHSFGSEDEYLEALTDYKAQQAIAKREREQQEARMNAEAQEIANAWNKRQEQVMKDIPDYADVVGAVDIPLAPHVHQAIVESEVGPHLAYYLALNPDELKRLNAMRPVVAVRHLMKLEHELGEEVTEAPEAPKQPKSKAPAPIDPVKESSANPGPASSYEEYRRRRKAQQGK